MNSGSADANIGILLMIISISLYICLYLLCLLITRGDSVTFGMVVLICLHGEGKIIWDLTRLKLQGTKSVTCALKFGADLISWGLIFLVYHGPSIFFQLIIS